MQDKLFRGQSRLLPSTLRLCSQAHVWTQG